MYFGYGWPKVLGGAAQAQHRSQHIYLFLDVSHAIDVTETCIGVWTGGQHRVKIGHADAVAGVTHVAACWSPARSLLALLTSDNVLRIYALHDTKVPALPLPGKHMSRVEVYCKESTPLAAAAAQATSLVCDARSIVVGFADGTLAAFSWNGKAKGDAVDPLGEVFDDDSTADDDDDAGSSVSEAEELPGSRPGLNPGSAPLSVTTNGSVQHGRCAIVHMHHCDRAKLLALVLGDGSVAMCRTADSELAPLLQLELSHWLCGPATRATFAAIGAPAQMVAVGTAAGDVHLYHLHPPASNTSGSAPNVLLGAPASDMLIRTLDLEDWGHPAAALGAVSALAWAPDCRAVAVGHAGQGLVVWSPSGCRLLCTLRQASAARSEGGRQEAAATAQSSSTQSDRAGSSGNGSSSSPHGTDPHSNAHSIEAPSIPAQAVLDGGIVALAWGPLGYQLLVAEAAPARRLVELQLAKSMPGHHRVAHAQGAAGVGKGAVHVGGELHALQAHDRLLFVTEAVGGQRLGSILAASLSGMDPGDNGSATSDLMLHHVPLPASYLASNWPLEHVAVSPNGLDVAAAGRQGLVLYSRQSERWRLFGDVAQERRINCLALCWLDNTIVVCTAPEPTQGGQAGEPACQLLLFPRNHLDFASLVASYDLPQVPLAMDCLHQHIIIPSDPLELTVLALEHPKAAAAATAAAAGAAGHTRTKSSSSNSTQGPQARLVPVRELTMFNPGRPLLDIALVPDVGPASSSSSISSAWLQRGGDAAAASSQAQGGSSSSNRTGTNSRGEGGASSSRAEGVDEGGSDGSSGSRGRSRPRQCVLLRWGGLMSVLDLEQGSELALSSEVECFWLSDTLPVGSPFFSSAASTGTSRIISRSASMQSTKAAIPAMPGTASSGLNPMTSGGSLTPVTSGGYGHLSTGGSLGAKASGLLLEEAVAKLRLAQSVQEASTAGTEPEVVEMPWWAYGPQGMQLWFPSLLSQQPVGISSTTSGHLPASLTPTGSSAAQRQQSLSLGSPAARAGALGSPAGRAGSAAGTPFAARLGSGGGAAKLREAGATDIELEFDREVYPIGVSLADAAIVGVTQRLTRSAMAALAEGQASTSSSTPCFHPVPESQPVLPCLLRRLLQKGATSEALALARRHAAGPHFGRSLEWLLFTTLDSEGARPVKARSSYGRYTGTAEAAAAAAKGTSNKSQSWRSGSNPTRVAALPIRISPLLSSAAELVLSFPQYADVVVSVARKTDASLWPALFTAVGSPSALLEHLLDTGALKSAACFLLVVDRLEGAPLAHGLALSLIRATLRRSHYFLAAEVLRFMLPPSEVGAFANGSASAVAADKMNGGRGGTSGGGGAASAAQQSSGGAGVQGSSNESRGGWFSWLWGGSGSAAAASGGADAGQSSAAAGAGSATGSSAAASNAKQGSAGPAASAVPKLSVAGSYRRSAGGANAATAGAAAGSSGGAGGSGSTGGAPIGRAGTWEGLSLDGVASGMDACQLVADHGWLLLEQGKLSALCQLVQAMSFSPGGLAAMMRAYRDAFAQPGTAAQQAQEELGVEELLGALAAAMAELPVWESQVVEQDATAMLQFAQSLGVQRWVMALALLVVDMSVILRFREAHPQTWEQFCTRITSDPACYFLHEVVYALSGKRQQNSSAGSSSQSSGDGGKPAAEQQHRQGRQEQQESGLLPGTKGMVLPAS